MGLRRALSGILFLLVATLPALAQTVPLGPRFVLPFQTVVDSTGAPIPGAQLYFYASGTNTPLATYSDALLTVPNANPVQANASGVFPAIFMAGDYKVVLTDSSNNQIWTADPVFAPTSVPSGSFAALPPLVVTFPGGVATFALSYSQLLVPVTSGGTGGTSWTAGLPLIGNGSGALAQGSRSGNTTDYATVSGPFTNGDCLSSNNGNFIDANVVCNGTTILTLVSPPPMMEFAWGQTIGAQNCVSAPALNMAQARPYDVVRVGVAPGFNQSLEIRALVTANAVVTINFCNPTASSITFSNSNFIVSLAQ